MNILINVYINNLRILNNLYIMIVELIVGSIVFVIFVQLIGTVIASRNKSKVVPLAG